MPAPERSRPAAPPADEPVADEPVADDDAVAAIELALHSLGRRLKLARLHDYLGRLAGDGVDQAGLAVLYALQGEDGVRVTDVAARLGIDAPAVTRKAQQLERLSLVSRARDADDARVSRLQLTPDGDRVLAQFMLARHQWLTSLLADWSPAERCDFARLIARLADDIERHTGELDR